MYWLRRNGEAEPLARTWTGPTDAHGIQCSSWSTDPAERLKMPTERDMDEVEYIWVQGIGSEDDRNGISMPVTGTSRRP